MGAGASAQSMKLLELLKKESSISFPSLVFTAGIAGLSNAAVLAIINTSAGQAASDIHSIQHVAMFGIVMALYIIAQRHIMLTTAAEIENILDRIRVRIADKLRRCDLAILERIGRSDIYACVSKETVTISYSAVALMIAAQSAILTFFTILYIAWLSLTAFVLSTAFMAVAVSIQFKQREKLAKDLQKSIARENELLDSLTDMLDGFKEVKMNRARSADLFAHIKEVSDSARELKTQTQFQLATNFISSQVIFYLLLATVVFIVPRFSQAYSDIVVKVATAVLFLVGPVSVLMGSIPVLAAANASCDVIAALEERLDQGLERAVTAALPMTSFREISFDGVFFRYMDPTAAFSFSVGPIDLTITAGEVLFITGGNGSGKSTLMKLLTGLYRPMGGVIRLDGVDINEANIDAYRQLFSVVFSDYHLFRRLYGLRAVDPAQVEALLAEMELEKKTRLSDNSFQTLELSTGQRKRLALLVSLLENRPIYVLDEWAADQDMAFRRKFYEEILPRLRKSGKTVVAVTHDDRYYHVADRVIKMEMGKITKIEPGSSYGR
jgi:putative pyoverdin transport system ATP-binding/permease protein